MFIRSKKFAYRKNTKPAIGRKITSFQQNLGKIDSPKPRSGNFICSKGVRDTILESSSAKDYSKIGDSIQNAGIVNRSGDYGHAGQRSHKYVEYHIPGQFLRNILLVKKKDGRNRRCINLKTFNKVIPYKHFKIECLHCLNYPLEEDNFLCKIDLKYILFLSVTVHELKKVCEISLFRKSLRVSLPLF